MLNTAHAYSGRPRRPFSPRPRVRLESQTLGLEALLGEVLLLLDEENLRFSARDLGYRVSFATLLTLIQGASARCVAHAFLSAHAETDPRAEYLRSRGYQVHVNLIEEDGPHRGRRPGNSDNLLLFQAGCLVSRSTAECVVIGTGDGELAHSLAKGIRTLPAPRRIFTMSLPGSTSRRLDSRFNRYLDGNLEIGRDALRPWN